VRACWTFSFKRLHGGAQEKPEEKGIGPRASGLGLENSSQRGVAVDDGELAALQAAGAAEADVGGKDPAEHYFRAQLGARARVQLEAAVWVVLGERVSHIAVER